MKNILDNKSVELLNRGLPKWSQMIVTGGNITEDQALEIIRRTDTFITHGYDGNNRRFNEEARKILGIEERKWRMDFKNSDGEIDDDAYDKYRDKFDKREEEWKNKWKPIELSYVHNSWISCSFIGGAHGWCHPDGTIGYVDNIGKYPSVEEVYEDWIKLAKEFPFLSIGMTLMDGEGCEDNTQAVISMKIHDGMVELIDPKAEDVHKEHNKMKDRDIEDDIKRLLMGNGENAISLSIIRHWRDSIFS